MSRNPKDIAAEALELPLAARAELASQLLESLDDLSEEENDQLWAKEADRRYAECKAGNIEAISADEVVRTPPSTKEVRIVRFLRPAEVEVNDAVEYFDDQRNGLGDRFEQDLLETIAFVRKHPLSGKRLTKVVRRFPIVRSGTALFMPLMTTRSSSSPSHITAAAPLTGVIVLRSFAEI